jgi:RimJ/RimL family protein N-acetyltransferase
VNHGNTTWPPSGKEAVFLGNTEPANCRACLGNSAGRPKTRGAAMKIVVNDQVHLSAFQASDKAALLEHLNDRDIYDRTLRIPFPYTEVDADEWLTLVAKITQQQGQAIHFAIRNVAEMLIGGCGFDGFQIGKSHRAEVGYWLAKPYWGRGIMTAVVQRLCQHAFAEFGLVKITAHVFAHNVASARVLEKCEFAQEGLLRKHYLKDDKLIDARLFALLR